MAIIKFSTNVPQVINFDVLEAEQVEGNYGPQYLYQLGDDRLYATELLYKTISAGCGAFGPGDYEVAKMEGEDGKKYWIIKDGPDGTVVADSRSLGASKAPPKPQTPAPTPAPTQTQNAAPAASEAQAARHKPSLVDVGAQMFSCLRMADAMWEYLSREATPETIQASAATMYIQANKQGLQPNEKQQEAFKSLMAEVVQREANDASQGIA